VHAKESSSIAIRTSDFAGDGPARPLRSLAVMALCAVVSRYGARVLDEWGDLKRVIAVAKAVDMAPGARLVVTALELWDRGIVLHATELRPEYLPPMEPIPDSQSFWRLFDDVGTVYPGCGASGTGSQAHVITTREFKGTPPETATYLSVLAPGMRDEQAIVISLI
jgi:hypothetical protein